MGALLGLVGFVGLIVGGISLIRPISFLRIHSRQQAAVVLGVSFLVLVVGVVMTPPIEETDDGVAADSVTLAPSTSTATSTTHATETTQPATTSTAGTTTTVGIPGSLGMTPEQSVTLGTMSPLKPVNPRSDSRRSPSKKGPFRTLHLSS